jgi:type IV secretory pathway VirB2 component (pilin)
VSAAFAALVAALSVVFALAVNTTSSQPIETYLNVLLDFVRGDSLRLLSAG